MSEIGESIVVVWFADNSMHDPTPPPHGSELDATGMCLEMLNKCVPATKVEFAAANLDQALIALGGTPSTGAHHMTVKSISRAPALPSSSFGLWVTDIDVSEPLAREGGMMHSALIQSWQFINSYVQLSVVRSPRRHRRKGDGRAVASWLPSVTSSFSRHYKLAVVCSSGRSYVIRDTRHTRCVIAGANVARLWHPSPHA